MNREGAGTRRAATGTLKPVSGAERHGIVDVVRGFALFGVLLANLSMTQRMAATLEHVAMWPDAGLEELIASIRNVLVSGKAHTLFAVLFGVGFAIQAERATARRAPLAPSYCRRLGYLFLISIGHTFIWWGDILHIYALTGFLLLAFRRCRQKTLLIWAVTFAVIPPLLYTAALTLGLYHISGPFFDPNRAVAMRSALTDGGFLDVVVSNWVIIRDFIDRGASLMAVAHALGHFLLGMFLWRTGILQAPSQHLPVLRKAWRWGLAFGLIGVVLALDRHMHFMPRGRALPVISALLRVLAVNGMACFYLAALVLLFQKPRWRRALSLLGGVGRMALTSYIGHSLFYMVLLYGLGFGLIGRFGSAVAIPVAIGFFAVQIAFSRWWLQRFRFGPMEWLWRSLSYQRLQPMCVRAAADAPASPRSEVGSP